MNRSIIKMWWCRLCIICAFLLISVTTFNIDSYNYAVYSGPERSMFGFSLTTHRQSNYGWLIVGAPEAQSGYQRSVYRGGAVYKCPVDRDGNCQEIPFDTKDDNHDQSGAPIDNKTAQWFGATVSSSGKENGPVVACAPRYTWFARGRHRKDPVGTCYVSNGYFDNFNEYAPCRTNQWGYHRQGSCQAGFSAAINSVGDRLFIGSPGSWYWQGQMYSIDAHATFEYQPSFFSKTYGDKGQVHQQSLETRPAVFATTEGSVQDDVSYLGYSMVIADFVGTGKEESIAVGMPRGHNLYGKVLLFTWNLTNFFHNFSSDQLGSYYGYALAASDVDGDGRVDLIIGAPMYTITNTEGKYDVGRVYIIYHNSARGKFAASYVIDGFDSKSRFGQALASLGDVNQDGYGDFAVGAPYGGPHERGAVYIYHGSSKGCRTIYSQVIFAEDVQPGPTGFLSTFGFSITGGLDLDNNGYPDMAVGSYLSNTAHFFRARPVVKVDAQVRYSGSRKEIDIKNANYQLRNGGTATLTDIDFCIKYSGEGIPHNIDLDLQYVLDLNKPKNARMGFVDSEGRSVLNDTISLYKDRPETCITKRVYVKSDIRDKLTPLIAEVKYWIREKRSTFVDVRNPTSQLTPILNLDSPPSRKDSITIHKDCGSDNICIPDLQLSVKPNVDQYLLGSTDVLTFDVIVSNHGEDSFETTLEVMYPKSIYFSRKEDKIESNVLCNTIEDQNLLQCEIGNPIPKNKVVRFTIYWQTSIKEGMDPSYEFDVYVNSTNQEKLYTRANNHVHVSVGIWSNSTLDISGKSHPSEVYFNSSLYKSDISIMKDNIPFEQRLSETAIGPQVTHIYYLRNEGPATIEEIEVYFIWPSFTLGHDDFLYLLEKPQFLPNQNVVCDAHNIDNHLNFNIEKSQESIWERLQLNNFQSTSSSNFSNFTSTNSFVIGSVVGGGNAQNTDAIDSEIGVSGDGSNIHQKRYNITFNEHSQPGMTTITKTSEQHFDTINGVTRVRQNNRTELTNSSGTFVTHNGGDGAMFDGQKVATSYGGVVNRQGNQHVSADYGGNVQHQGHSVNTGGGGFQTNKHSQAAGGAQTQSTYSHSGSSKVYTNSRESGYNSGGVYHSMSGGSQHYGGGAVKTEGTAGGSLHHLSGGAYDGEEYDEGDEEEEEEYEEEKNDQTISGYYDSNGNYISSQSRQIVQNRSGSSYGQQSSNRGYTVATLDLGDVGSNMGAGAIHRQHAATLGGGGFTTSNSGSSYSSSSSSSYSSAKGGQVGGSSSRHWSETQPVPSTHFNNVETPQEQRYYGNNRGKRQIYTQVYPEIMKRIPCKSVECSYMRCVVRSLKKDTTITIALRGRVNARVLRNVSGSQPTTFSSVMAARISKLPYIGETKQQEIYSYEITSSVPAPEAEIKPDVVPLWIIVLSAVAGTMILLLLIFLLYKLGFFKRNRPSSAPERQPLNRNGYHHGDEAL